jgi:hypothetical protein
VTTTPSDDRPTDSDQSIDHLPDADGAPLDADEGEPAVEPFAGDDDILSGHLNLPD